MKGFAPKTLSVSLTTVAVAFACGMAVATHPAKPPVPLYKATADVSQPTSQPVTDSTANDPSAPADPATGPDSTVEAASPAASTNTTPDTPTSQSPAQSDPTPAVVAVDAQVGDWSTPTLDEHGATIRTRQCLFTYSDGSSQQRVYESDITYSSGVKVLPEPNFDCTVANAPAAN